MQGILDEMKAVQKKIELHVTWQAAVKAETKKMLEKIHIEIMKTETHKTWDYQTENTHKTHKWNNKSPKRK